MRLLKNNKKKKSSSKKVTKLSSWRRRSVKQKYIAFLSITLFASIAAGIIVQSFAATADYGANDIQFVRLTAWRRQNGRSDLFRSQCMSQAAQDWAQRMADTNNLEHSGNSTLWPRCGTTGWKFLGENVGSGPDSNSIFDALVNSPGHNANMLDTKYNKVGIGAAQGNGKLWVVQIFANASGTPWDSPYNPPTKVVGTVDSASCTRVKGWAFDGANTSGSIPVDFYFADSTGSQGIRYNGTNILRQDVNNAYKITGYHGFDLGVPLKWQGRTFIVQAYGIDGGVNPSIGLKGVSCGKNYSIDHNAENVTYGWAIDRNYKADPLQITVRYCWDAGNTNCPTQKVANTDVYRPSVNDLFGATGYHGFKISTPSPFNAYDHYTFVYAKNTKNGDSMYIGGGHATLPCPKPSSPTCY